MKIAVVGTGYVGLVSGACLAALGHDVTCIDNDRRKIDSLRTGKVPFFEPGIEDLVAENVAQGRLSFTDDLPAGVKDSEVIFLAVGTPSRTQDGEADLRYVFSAVDDVADAVSDGTVLVSKSTVPVGTGDLVHTRLASKISGSEIDVVSCPEFLREGTAISDFMEPHRIVVGVESARAEDVMRRVYAPLTDKGAPLLVMRRRSAELTKYAANAYLAMRLAFINEMADFAESVSADIEEIAAAIGKDPRIGESYLRVGPGFGGSCFPKDTMALHRSGEEFHTALRLVETVIAVNDQRKRSMAHRIIDACGGSVAGKKVALLGITFKPDTDDLRDSPAIPIVGRLLARGATVSAYDPGLPLGVPGHPDFVGVNWCASVNDAVTDADVAVVVTDWGIFRAMDLRDLGTRMARPCLVDLRNLFDDDNARSAGLTYIPLGRAAVREPSPFELEHPASDTATSYSAV